MPEPLKNLYNEVFISSLARFLKSTCETFDEEGFQKSVFYTGWDQKELKERMNHIAEILHVYLPGNYRENIKSLKLAIIASSPLHCPATIDIFGITPEANV